MFFHWLWVLYRGLPLFFLECVYHTLLYTSLIFEMVLLLRVFVSVRWSGFGFHYQLSFFCVCVCVCWWFLCMWGSVLLNLLITFLLTFFVCIGIHMSKYVYIYIYIYIYLCVCLCFQIDAFVREHIWHKVYLMGIRRYIYVCVCVCVCVTTNYTINWKNWFSLKNGKLSNKIMIDILGHRISSILIQDCRSTITPLDGGSF